MKLEIGSLHLFVDDAPALAATWFLKRQVIGQFDVQSGTLVAAGEEIAIPGGTYELQAYVVAESREHFIDEQFTKSATAEERRAWNLGAFVPLMAISLTVTALAIGWFAFIHDRPALPAAAAVAVSIALWIYNVTLRRSAAYLAAETKYHEIERELPSVVVVLRS